VPVVYIRIVAAPRSLLECRCERGQQLRPRRACGGARGAKDLREHTFDPAAHRQVGVEGEGGVEQPDAAKEDASDVRVDNGGRAGGSDGEQRVVAVMMREVDRLADPHPVTLCVEGPGVLEPLTLGGAGCRKVRLQGVDGIGVHRQGGRSLAGMDKGERQAVREDGISVSIGVAHGEHGYDGSPVDSAQAVPQAGHGHDTGDRLDTDGVDPAAECGDETDR
jgi:hypothetical protein